mmetsp:Transcript_6859/g.15682  ORF Transcript_6859/g.15682 Transcript_6859/m.15682 type:complete len:170 (+) Transcript_6859:96-605(+)
MLSYNMLFHIPNKRTLQNSKHKHTNDCQKHCGRKKKVFISCFSFALAKHIKVSTKNQQLTISSQHQHTMASRTANLQRRTSDVSSLVDNVRNEDKHQSKHQDPFLFYSNPANLRKLSMDFNGEDSSSANVQVVRKTRISCEKDPFTVMMEDLDFAPSVADHHLSGKSIS